jgi:mannose-1-phosphate guanylyltransferase
MTAAFVLAAGLGTRLRPITHHVPKPLVPIGDLPALVGVLRAARRAVGPSPVVVNAFHLADDVERVALAEGARVSREEVLLGTAGGLAKAQDLLGSGDVLVYNADIFTTFEPSTLLEAWARRERPSDSRGMLAFAPRAKGEGTLGIGEDGRIVRLRGETFGDEARGGDFVGIHVVGAALREALPEVGCLVGDVYLPALRKGTRVGSLAIAEPFVDVGTLGSYLEANLAWLGSHGVSTTAEGSFVAASATVDEGARVVASVIGEGARVSADLEQCVVLPGSHVTERLTRAIATPFGSFPVDVA